MHRFAIFLSLVCIAAGADFKGFGTTPGGRGGSIIRVTTLDASGPGSLREALATKGPRIIVFEVGGVIDLAKSSLKISEPFVTIAGQTAPKPGITIIRGSIGITGHDIVIQHIRVRPGDAGMPKKSGWEPEVTTAGAYNVLVDHCSFSWAVDENLSVSGPRYDGPDKTSHDLTYSNNIIAEGLYDSSHTKGIHSMGTLVHDQCRNIAIIGNLYAHNNQRNPYFKALTTGVIVNNLIYNPGTAAIQVNWPESEWVGQATRPANCKVAVSGNVLVHGANTSRGLALVSRKGDAFLEDNLAFDRNGAPAPLTSGYIKILPQHPVWPEGLVPLPAAKVIAYVTANAGARPRERDVVDQRIIREFEQRKGRLIDSQEEVGGYPKVTPTRRKLDIPARDVEQWLAKLAKDLE